MYNAIIAKPHCIFVPAARAAGCDLSVLLGACLFEEITILALKL